MRSVSATYSCQTALLLFCALTSPASAQDMSKYYTVMHPEEFEIDWAGFYREAEKRTADVRDRFPHHLNLAYGDDRKQQLDLYLPKTSTNNAPVFLFLHGGGFREGDRAQYGFVAEPFAHRGIITAVASYRLTTDGYHYPAQPEDTRSAITWLHKHIAEYGGNAEAVYVGGHSAGAILAADVGVDRSWMEERGIPSEALRGIVPISGPYDLRTKGRPGEGDAYAPSEELELQASPVLHVKNPAPASLVAVGSTEKRFLDSSEEFVAEMTAKGAIARLLVLDGQDHKDTVVSLADPDSPLFQMTLELINASQESARD